METIKKAQQEYEQLHFEKALQLLEKEEPRTENGVLWLIRIKRALYEFDQAYELSRTHNEPDFVLERAKCLFASGKVKEASSLLETMEPTIPVRLCYAGVLSETGKVGEALSVLDAIDEDRLAGFQFMDLLLLKADLYSFQEKTRSAFEYYEKALDHIDPCIPENWRSLRAMLIHHNMADTYEQLEQEDKAIELYETALGELTEQKKTDDTITDLASYEIELLLSAANCYGNNEQFEQARRYLDRAKGQFDQLLPLSRPYFTARIHYISGLIDMNDGKEEEAAFHLRKAFDEQRRLVRKGRDKREHLARTAYYLGSLLGDEEKEEKLRLFETACPLFEQVVEKEPPFYMAALADMANEKGRLASSGQEALQSYREAMGWYEKMLETDPEDALAYESLLVTRVNAMKYDPAAFEEKVKCQLEFLRHDKENVPFVYSICDALLAQDHSKNFFRWLRKYIDSLPAEFEA